VSRPADFPDLQNLLDKMEIGTVAETCCKREVYVNMVRCYVAKMPKMSTEKLEQLMDMLYCAFQAGRCNQ
jgi:hypothetical protein